MTKLTCVSFCIAMSLMACSKTENRPLTQTGSTKPPPGGTETDLQELVYPNFIPVFALGNGIYSATYYGATINFSIPYYLGTWNEGDLACNCSVSITPVYSYMTVKLTTFTLFDGTVVSTYQSTYNGTTNPFVTNYEIIRTHSTASTFGLVNASYKPTNPPPPPVTIE